METSARPRVAALALAVGVVLADSSIVVLALPEIYRELNTSISGVTWVLISFNLVIALAAVPAALVARRVGPGRTAAVGPGDLRRRRPRLRAGRRSLDPDRRPLRAGARRRRRGHRGAGAAAGDGRLGAAGGDRLGRRRGDRRRAGTGGRRPAHRARLLAVDLPDPGAGGAGRRGADPLRRQTRGGDRDHRNGGAPDRPTAPLGESGAGDGLGGDRRRALPARPAADRRLAPEPDRSRARRHGDAAGGDPRQPPDRAGARTPARAPPPGRSSSPAASPGSPSCRRRRSP